MWDLALLINVGTSEFMIAGHRIRTQHNLNIRPALDAAFKVTSVKRVDIDDYGCDQCMVNTGSFKVALIN